MEFYSTFVSDSTQKYSGNKAGSFTSFPDIRLAGEGWKVAIAQAMLPRMALFPSLQNENVNLMELWSETKKAGKSDEYQKGFFKSSDLRDWEKQGIASNGLEFFNNVKHRLEETAHSELSQGYRFTDWQSLEWSKESQEPELKLTHSVKSNTIYIYKPFAKALQWMQDTNNHDEQVGPNLIHSYPLHLKGASSLDTNKPIKQFPSWLWLSTLSDWRFINLNQSFQQANQLFPRALQVQAKLTHEKKSVLQPLGHVYYAPLGRERCWYTPVKETFYEVASVEWREVEINLQELNNKPVTFQPDSPCSIVLHFKKDTL